MKDTRFHRRQDWTDVAVIAGPTMRWTEDDYEDLAHAYPEVFLGLQVILMTWGDLEHRLRGRVVNKIVLLDGAGEPWPRGLDCELSYLHAQGVRIEHWYVHRGESIHRIAA